MIHASCDKCGKPIGPPSDIADRTAAFFGAHVVKVMAERCGANSRGEKHLCLLCYGDWLKVVREFFK